MLTRAPAAAALNALQSRTFDKTPICNQSTGRLSWHNAISCSNTSHSPSGGFLPAYSKPSSRSTSARLYRSVAAETCRSYNCRCEPRLAGHSAAPVVETFFDPNVTFMAASLSRGAAGSITRRERIH